MKIINCEQDSLYTTEYNVAVNRVELLAIGCHILCCEVDGVMSPF